MLFIILFTCMQCFNEVATHGALWIVYKIHSFKWQLTHRQQYIWIWIDNELDGALSKTVCVRCGMEECRVYYFVVRVSCTVYTNTWYNYTVHLDSFLRFYHMKFEKMCTWNETKWNEAISTYFWTFLRQHKHAANIVIDVMLNANETNIIE